MFEQHLEVLAAVNGQPVVDMESETTTVGGERGEGLRDQGPTVLELLAIEAEWPLYAAELAVVEAECRFISTPDVLARRALRRAVAGLTRAYVEFYGPRGPVCLSLAHDREDLICEEGVKQCSTSK